MCYGPFVLGPHDENLADGDGRSQPSIPSRGKFWILASIWECHLFTEFATLIHDYQTRFIPAAPWRDDQGPPTQSPLEGSAAPAILDFVRTDISHILCWLNTSLRC